MTEAEVHRDLEWVRKHWSRLFSCDDSGNDPARAPRLPSAGTANHGGRIFAVDAKCENCGASIGKDEQRKVLAAFVISCQRLDEEELLDGQNWDDEGYLAIADLKKVFHYCSSCTSAEEIRVHYPWGWRPSPEQVRQWEESNAEAIVEVDAERQRINLAIARGDIHALSRAMPMKAVRGDAMARSKPFRDFVESEEARRGQCAVSNGDDEAIGANEIIDRIASTDSPDRPSTEIRRTTVSKDGPALMAEFLRSPRSTTLKPFQRRVAELYSLGKTQLEIVKEIGTTSQPTVCRALQHLKGIIHVSL